MKIAISVNSSWNIFNFRMGLARHLMNCGFEVYAISPEDEFSSELIHAGLQHIPVSVQSKGSSALNDIRYMLTLRSVYKKIKPDLILHYTIKPNIYGSLAAASLGIPVINNVSGLGTVFLHDNISTKIAKALYKMAFRFPQKVFFQNEDDRSLFVKKNLIAINKTALIPGSGVNTEKFLPNEKKNFRKGTPFRFLLMARLLYDKGIIEYIKAIELIQARLDAIFMLAGGLDEESKLGIPASQLQDWINRGLIEYKGFEKNSLKLYQEADCVVLPSYREGTSKSLLEAASCGIPIVTTDVPGCREVVEDGINGFLCKVKDPEDLAMKMEALYNLPEEIYTKMAIKSREKAQKQFDEKIVIKTYEAAIVQILAAKRGQKH
ncbi:glycosyltransferase family 4 protein [Sporocytophaga myxococcoides]|uniref:glycosyltransferase family 4 protein n=1 Tax=Sporocytophaga myxococcoides TaxID=153721 RepID=UPI0003FC5E39|nr:glycosyltransferase family 4 protein [Sporocytophaga myxococcoides]